MHRDVVHCCKLHGLKKITIFFYLKAREGNQFYEAQNRYERIDDAPSETSIHFEIFL